MDTDHFDHITRVVSTIVARRNIVGAFGLGIAGLPLLGDARKKRKKRKKKKIKRNAFGCVNVGSFCKNSGQCCSGICQGKKDKKKCQAHDTGGCTGAQDVCSGVPVPCETATGEAGNCVRTTGNGGYCNAEGNCFPCRRDADCQTVCGPQAACIVCEQLCGPNGTACSGPSPAGCNFPS